MRTLTVIFLLFSSSGFAGDYDLSWLKDAFWDSGKAEVSIFDAVEMRYGIPRKNAEAIFILVKEDHLPSQNVKANNWKQPGLLPRIKFNEVITVPTGIYTYRQMLSIYFDKKTFDSPKTSFGSQEWCGQTFKELLIQSGKAILDFNSYWENEAKGKKEFKFPEGTILYNALPVVLRAMHPDKIREEKLNLFSDLISNKVGDPKVFDAQANFKGKQKNGWLEVDLTWKEEGKEKIDHYSFSTDPLNPLEKFERNDGAVYKLRKRIHDDYWKHNNPGDEKLLRKK